jgi:hypothetical protein
MRGGWLSGPAMVERRGRHPLLKKEGLEFISMSSHLIGSFFEMMN